MSETSRKPGDPMDVAPDQAQGGPPTEGVSSMPGGHNAHENRLARIRNLLDSGNYEVPAIAIAERMLDSAVKKRHAKD
ncbi:MAG: flagellar biosynthesis anti-sigma factor FlgM [Actinobacteria bacterium]|nr:flagellar biosynthesis anti-sigma factor FlgM [Actinomycetota bacterium]